MNQFKRLIRKAGLEEMKASLLQAQLTDFMTVQNYYQNFESIAGITKFPIFSVQDNFNGSDNEIIKHIIQNDNEVFNYLWTNNVSQFGTPTIDENIIKQNIEIELHGSNQFMIIINSNAEALQNQSSSDFEVVDYEGTDWENTGGRDLIVYYVACNIPITDNIYMNKEAKEGSKKAIERFVNEKFGTDTEFTKFFIESIDIRDLLYGTVQETVKFDIQSDENVDEQSIQNIKDREYNNHIDHILSQINKSNDPLEQAKEIENIVGKNTIIEFAVENSEVEYVEVE